MMQDLLVLVRAFFERPSQVLAIDLLDVTVVAIVIYRVLLVLKGTRAMQAGLVLLSGVAAYQFARTFKLVTLFTIFDGLLGHAVLIIVVVFQNDIRRALLRFARRPLFRVTASARDIEIIEEVVRGAQHLAQKRIGGLIVFERDAGLDEFIDQGTVIDAAVSKELIYSIFVPSFENPMHDGAAILRDGRVWQAGAVLPLSSNSQLEKTLGTRHRAALGITEETDAVVVVISEERGAMSLCFGGNIVPGLDGVSLREALMGLFATKAPRAKVEPARKSLSPRASTPPGRGSVPPPSLGPTQSSPGRISIPPPSIAPRTGRREEDV